MTTYGVGVVHTMLDARRSTLDARRSPTLLRVAFLSLLIRRSVAYFVFEFTIYITRGCLERDKKIIELFSLSFVASVL